MFTPKDCIESYESYRKGEKKFCRLASISDKHNNDKMDLGFWIEVISNDRFLALLIRYKSFTNSVPAEIRFFRKKQLENFVEHARVYISSELENKLRTKKRVKRQVA